MAALSVLSPTHHAMKLALGSFSRVREPFASKSRELAVWLYGKPPLGCSQKAEIWSTLTNLRLCFRNSLASW